MITNNHKQKDNAVFPKIQQQNVEHEHHDSSAISLKKQLRFKTSLNQQIEEKKQQKVIQTVSSCRICLEQGSILSANNEQQLKQLNSNLEQEMKSKQSKYLIKTCLCNGTSGYIHQKCLIQWISTQIKRTKQKHIKCEICLSEILYNRKNVHFFDFRIQNFQDTDSCQVTFFTSLLILLIICVSVYSNADQLKLLGIIKTTLIVIIVSFSLTLILLIILIMKSVMWRSKKQIDKLYTRDQIDLLRISLRELSHYEIRSTHRSVRTTRSRRSIRINDNNPNQNHQNEQNQLSQRTGRTASIRRDITRTSVDAQVNEDLQPNNGQRSVRYVNSITHRVRSRQNVNDEDQ